MCVVVTVGIVSGQIRFASDKGCVYIGNGQINYELELLDEVIDKKHDCNTDFWRYKWINQGCWWLGHMLQYIQGTGRSTMNWSC